MVAVTIYSDFGAPQKKVSHLDAERRAAFTLLCLSTVLGERFKLGSVRPL